MNDELFIIGAQRGRFDQSRTSMVNSLSAAVSMCTRSYVSFHMMAQFYCNIIFDLMSDSVIPFKFEGFRSQNVK